jgi:dTDP-4-amino-4,6-dideoxygalactose transaminase
MAAILSEIGPGDSFIVPSYTFVSSANAFVLRGAHPKFADSMASIPHMGLEQVKKAWDPSVKVVVVVHYAGVSMDLRAIRDFCSEKGVLLVEDAAQSMGAFLPNEDNVHLGTVGDLATFSFHETKNISCGEGGCLVVNNQKFWDRACIIWEKGTNRQAFFKGEVDKYGWMDVGSSFLPNELTLAYLYAQLEQFDEVTHRRSEIWREYDKVFRQNLPASALPGDWSEETNGHLYYLLAESEAHRDEFIRRMKDEGISTHFHYQSLHQSAFARRRGWHADAPNADQFSVRLVRLPLHLGLDVATLQRITTSALNAW